MLFWAAEVITGRNLSPREGRWQVKCYHSLPGVSITLKTSIRYNGKEYSSPAELPPEIRLAYEKALHEGAVKKKFVINGQKFESEDAMSPDVRRLCDDMMSVIENNGEVTIPNNETEPLLTKKQIAIVGLVAGGVIALVLTRLALG